jgi:hypothetical protein
MIMTTELTAPSLPDGSVDFNALHDFAKKAKTQEQLDEYVAGLAPKVAAALPAALEPSAEIETPAKRSDAAE